MQAWPCTLFRNRWHSRALRPCFQPDVAFSSITRAPLRSVFPPSGDMRLDAHAHGVMTELVLSYQSWSAQQAPGANTTQIRWNTGQVVLVMVAAISTAGFLRIRQATTNVGVTQRAWRRRYASLRAATAIDHVRKSNTRCAERCRKNKTVRASSCRSKNQQSSQVSRKPFRVRTSPAFVTANASSKSSSQNMCV